MFLINARQTRGKFSESKSFRQICQSLAPSKFHAIWYVAESVHTVPVQLYLLIYLYVHCVRPFI